MNPTHGPTATHGMQNKRPPLGESGVELSPASLYDSEQIPVLIRMPDLTPDVTSMAAANRRPQVDAKGPTPPPEPPQETEPSGPPQTDRRQRRREPARAGRPGAAGPLQTLLSSIPSTVLVMVVLLAVTAIVYILMQGGPKDLSDESTVAWSSTEGSAEADPDERQVEPSEVPSAEVDLWRADDPAEDANDASLLQVPMAGDAGPPSDADFELWGPENTEVLAPSTDLDGPDHESLAMPAAPDAGTHSGENSGVMDGPILSWGPDELQGDSQPTETGPVQGWPPELDGGFSAGASAVRPRAAVPNAGGTYFGSPRPSISYGGAPSLRTGMRSAESLGTRAASNLPGAATFKGTIEFPQPRVNDERTQPGVY